MLGNPFELPAHELGISVGNGLISRYMFEGLSAFLFFASISGLAYLIWQSISFMQNFVHPTERKAQKDLQQLIRWVNQTRSTQEMKPLGEIPRMNFEEFESIITFLHTSCDDASCSYSKKQCRIVTVERALVDWLDTHVPGWDPTIKYQASICLNETAKAYFKEIAGSDNYNKRNKALLKIYTTMVERSPWFSNSRQEVEVE